MHHIHASGLHNQCASSCFACGQGIHVLSVLLHKGCHTLLKVDKTGPGALHAHVTPAGNSIEVVAKHGVYYSHSFHHDAVVQLPTAMQG